MHRLSSKPFGERDDLLLMNRIEEVHPRLKTLEGTSTGVRNVVGVMLETPNT